MSQQLIQSLQNPALYDHPVTQFKVLETHTSWVILTGSYAYKIKKPLDFQFLDYSTLEKRHYYCQKEIALNKTLAPAIYLEVVTIYGRAEQPTFKISGMPIEYAIKMREFSQDALLTKLLEQNAITPELIDKLAHRLAVFHQQAEQVNDPFLGTPQQVHGPVRQNFDQIRPLLTDKDDLQLLAYLEDWSEQQYQQLQTILQTRKEQGFIRACHGDVHLGNIILYKQEPVIFDCIEFNEEFRWTDVMADLGFLAMDLDSLQRPDLAHRVINTYLAHTGDYSGLQVLPYYQAYRAVVRAKVALLRLAQPGLSESEQTAVRDKYRNCINLALQYAQQKQPVLIITHGVSGSGKSTIARLVVEHLGAIQISSDRERKRLFGMEAHARNNSEVNKGIYAPEETAKTYARMLKLAITVLRSGYTTIVDATFLKFELRQQFKQLAQDLQLPFLILHCEAPHEQLMLRVHERYIGATDPSEANIDVLHMQQGSKEVLKSYEYEYALSIDINHHFDKQQMLHQLGQLIAKIKT